MPSLRTIRSTDYRDSRGLQTIVFCHSGQILSTFLSDRMYPRLETGETATSLNCEPTLTYNPLVQDIGERERSSTTFSHRSIRDIPFRQAFR